jgi:hypothetical protein
MRLGVAKETAIMAAKAMGTVQAAGCARSAPTPSGPDPSSSNRDSDRCDREASAGEQTGGGAAQVGRRPHGEERGDAEVAYLTAQDILRRDPGDGYGESARHRQERREGTAGDERAQQVAADAFDHPSGKDQDDRIGTSSE